MSKLPFCGTRLLKPLIVTVYLVLTSLSANASVIPENTEAFINQQLPEQIRIDYQPALDALKQNDFPKVIALARGYVNEKASDPNAHMLLILGWIGLEDQMAIRRHLQELKLRLPAVFNVLNYQTALYYAQQKRYFLATERLEALPASVQNGDSLRLHGEILENQGNLRSAILTYESLLTSEPDARDAMLALARLYLLSGDIEASLKHSRELQQAGVEQPVVHVLAGTAAMLKGDTQTARENFQKAVALDSKDPVAQVQLGNLLLLKDDAASALSVFEKANASRPFDEAWLGIAQASLALGKTDAALAALTKIQPQTFTDQQALTLAAARLAAGDAAGANAAYRQASGLYPDFESADFDFGRYASNEPAAAARTFAFSNNLYRQGYFRLIINQLELQRDLLDSSALLQLIYARSQWKAGNTDKAKEIYTRLKTDFPDLAAPLIEAADIAFYANDMKTALDGYEQAVKLKPASLNLRLRLAGLYNHLDRPQDALREFETALAASPASVYILDQIASTWLQKLKKPAEALKYVEKARAIDANNPDVLYTLAGIYDAQGKREESAKLYLELVSRNINNPDFYYDVGMSLLNSNKKPQAIRAFERVLNAGPAAGRYNDALSQYKELVVQVKA